MRPSESLKIAGKPIAYYPKLAKPLGSTNASILFSHFFYWHDKTQHELGIYRTAEEIELETGLSVQEQRTARAKLKERGILIETEKRIEHRIYYKLDLDAFDDLMLQHSRSEESTAPKCNINSPELQNQHSGSEESTAVIRTEDLTEDLTVNTYLSAEAETERPAVAKATATKPNAENKKRFEAVAKLFNQVFEDCPMVARVGLETVPNPQTGKSEYTKANQKRIKLIPYAWQIAKMRIDRWKDSDGLIDGEEPNGKHVLEWFRTYFEECKQDGFINGTSARAEAHKNWKADFDYMLKAETLEKRVLEK
nr:MAG TPA: hypothetical protein [Caudoviricetes sp.]